MKNEMTYLLFGCYFLVQNQQNNNSTKQKLSHLIFHRFQLFNYCLSIVLLPDDGDYPKHLQTVSMS